MLDDAITRLQNTLADCPEVQSFLGAANATEALARIHVDALPPPPEDAEAYDAAGMDALRPYVKLYFDDEFESFVYTSSASGQVSGDPGGCWEAGGVLVADFSRSSNSDVEPAASMREMRVHAGNFVREIAGRVEDEGMLNCQRIAVLGPFKTAEERVEDLGDAEWLTLRFSYGAGAAGL